MWFMMIVPHTLAHHYELISSLLLCVIFELSFALLQKKRDLTSAMVSHGLVDAIPCQGSPGMHFFTGLRLSFLSVFYSKV